MRLSLFLTSIAITSVVALPCNSAVKPSDDDGVRALPSKAIQPTRASDEDAKLQQSKAVQPTRGPDGGAPQMNAADGSDRWL